MQRLAGSVLLSAVLLASAAAHAQARNEVAVPDPTRLAELALAADARIQTLGDTATIDNEDATARISAVEVSASGGGALRGVRIDLSSRRRTDKIWSATAALRVSVSAESRPLPPQVPRRISGGRRSPAL